MSLDDKTISALADRVQHAQDHTHTITKLTDEHPSMSIEDGYAVQDELLRKIGELTVERDFLARGLQRSR